MTVIRWSPVRILLITTGVVLSCLLGTIAIVLGVETSDIIHSAVVLTRNAPYGAQVEVAAPLVAGQVGTLTIHITHRGQPVDLSEDAHLLHAILISDDYTDRSSTSDPVQTEVGIYTIQHLFTHAGRYRLWLEVDNTTGPRRHGEFADLLGYVDLLVQGTSVDAISPPLIPISDTESEGITASVFTSGLTRGIPGTITLLPRDTPPTSYIIVGPRSSFFRYDTPRSTNDGSAQWQVTFPTSGSYLFWIHFPDTSFPFLLHVKEAT